MNLKNIKLRSNKSVYLFLDKAHKLFPNANFLIYTPFFLEIMKLTTNFFFQKLCICYSLYYTYFPLQYFSYYILPTLFNCFKNILQQLLTTAYLRCSASNLHITLKVYGWKSGIYILLQILAEQLLVIQVSCHNIKKISIEQGDTANKKIKQKFQKLCLNLNAIKME